MLRTPKTAFGLGLLAALVLIAISAMSASATSSGHFTSDSLNGKTTFDITEQTTTTHTVRLTNVGYVIKCHNPSYIATVEGITTTNIKVGASYAGCTYSEESIATVDMNGCWYTFTPRSSGGNATVHFECPAGAKAAVTMPGTCESTFPPQTTSAVSSYDTIEANGKHAITVNINATGLTVENHGFCALFGTHRTDASMHGSLTVEGTEDQIAGRYVSITHT